VRREEVRVKWSLIKHSVPRCEVFLEGSAR